MFRLLILSDPRIEMFSHSEPDLFDQLAAAEPGKPDLIETFVEIF